MNKFSILLSKVSLRMRLTIFITCLLAISSMALTGIINFSAIKMASEIEAAIMTPATSLEPTLEMVPIENPLQPLLPSQPIQQVKRDFYSESVLAMLFIIAGGGFFTWYIAGKTLVPVKELSVQIKNITVHNLAKEIDVPSTKDEIADLTASFNEMAGRISEAFESQRRFSASAAHELRTPLAVLQTKLDVFRKKRLHSTEEYEGLINVITAQTERLSNLIKDLLNMTYVEENYINEEVDLALELSDILEELQPIADQRNISLELKGETSTLYGNGSLLQRAFYNLIENAIKYSTPGGRVLVNLVTLNNTTVITVADTGVGIPDSMKAHIFEPFFRVDKSRSRELGGAGLGLSIVKTILDNHGGSIIVKDNKPKGTIFQVTFPIK